MRNFYSSIYLALFLCVGLMNCNIINPHEPTPTYIHIDSFSFIPNPNDGSPSHNINTVWAYYNNSPVGVFDLPATFPVIASGTGTLELAPGIAINGMNDFETPYPFYTFDTFMFTAQPGKVINHKPVTTYTAGCNVVIISDFNAGIPLFDLDYGTAYMTTTNVDSLEFDGSPVGEIVLNTANDSSIDSSINSFSIDSAGNSFIEFNYKSTVPFYVGLQGVLGATGEISTSPTFLIGIYPSATWNKFYLNTAPFASQTKATNYRFYVKAPGGQAGKLLLDNIKRVSY